MISCNYILFCDLPLALTASAHLGLCLMAAPEGVSFTPGVCLEDLVRGAVQASSGGLTLLHKQLEGRMTEQQRRLRIRDYLSVVRGMLARVRMCVGWLREHPTALLPHEAPGSAPYATAQSWSKLIDLDVQHAALRSAADGLFFVHAGLGQACAPRYDTRAAVDLLALGNYTQLPLLIDAPPCDETTKKKKRGGGGGGGGVSSSEGVSSAPSKRQAREAARWLRCELRERRVHWNLPKGMATREVEGGVRCTVRGEYEITVTAIGKVTLPLCAEQPPPHTHTA